VTLLDDLIGQLPPEPVLRAQHHRWMQARSPEQVKAERRTENLKIVMVLVVWIVVLFAAALVVPG